MEKPLVSIIVPVFNVEKYLKRAVDSLLNQTYSNLEIILVDDGSPDKCPKMCDQYAEMDSRVKVIHKRNEGPSSARNAGLKIISGNYVTFLDSDDCLKKNAIQHMLELLVEYNVDAVCSSIEIIDDDNNAYDIMGINIPFICSGIETSKLLLKDIYPHNFAWGKLYKSELFKNMLFPENRLYEDKALIYKVLYRAKKVYCSDIITYSYQRSRPDNITSELNSSKAAWSYYCGCLNCIEAVEFCQNNFKTQDILPIVASDLNKWIKLCLESAMVVSKHMYIEYYNKIQQLIVGYEYLISSRIRMILQLKNLYYYIYPIIRHNK